MIDRDKVTEALKYYPSYRHAVRSYELPRLVAAGTADYSGMPKGGGFESRTPTHNDGTGFQDALDYQAYKQAVMMIEGALDSLTDDERAVIELKWMKGLKLHVIEDRRHMGIGYAKQIHRKALTKLVHALRFLELPEIHDLTAVKFANQKKKRFDLAKIG
jgi:hypothetical protein